MLSVQNTSLHQVWIQLYERIVLALKDVWNCVQQVLCDDAPEGHFPEDLDDNAGLTTKDVLSYSWRALKDARFVHSMFHNDLFIDQPSLLIRTLALRANIRKAGSNDHPTLSVESLISLTKLCFEELAILRHRGAFSAVALAFNACCLSLHRLENDSTLTELYLVSKQNQQEFDYLLAFQAALQNIQDKGSKITRRSAGLPSLVVGILQSNSDGPLFDTAIRDLTEQAQTKANHHTHGRSLPQVHALNCLRLIFTTTSLGDLSEPYAILVLGLAGDCLTSNIWAIRNCGLMLFRALIDRLLGALEQSESSSSSPSRASNLSWLNIPNFEETIIRLLAQSVHIASPLDTAAESVFPALKIIERIPPPESCRQKVQKMVLNLLHNPNWHVRDMAARTYAASFFQPSLKDETQKLLENCKDLRSQNQIHGYLLYIQYLSKRLITQTTQQVWRKSFFDVKLSFS
jgi:Putative death-receptor fusion protein (DUF2428)